MPALIGASCDLWRKVPSVAQGPSAQAAVCVLWWAVATVVCVRVCAHEYARVRVPTLCGSVMELMVMEEGPPSGARWHGSEGGGRYECIAVGMCELPAPGLIAGPWRQRVCLSLQVCVCVCVCMCVCVCIV